MLPEYWGSCENLNTYKKTQNKQIFLKKKKPKTTTKISTCFINQERTFTALHCSEQRLEVSDVGRTLHPTAWCWGILTGEIINN